MNVVRPLTDMLSIIVQAGTSQDCDGDTFYDCLVYSQWNGWEDPFQTQCAYATQCSLQWEDLTSEQQWAMMDAYEYSAYEYEMA